ncbi:MULTISPECIES: C69 family dipeptidase [Loigolactobacillus]|uniref:C69 family dipeptidase n=1 Tax=Loigolactobacillus TaxID=2767889 RepID=UPI0007F06C4D|nr:MULTISPECIES: C69 family dipeptidase [Loigolactobacillus]ANK58839.1 peptidase C69 [Loigolactobacillus backii]ANK63829.1 peptidase C69 [Loigolactobacillus backii]ANK66277.1 peptidase C69 [Loigolactobacillus backii]MDA5388375.1 C69 family dipeptidase [Loigolactobacillus backii]MDA5391300.1 C69 family dipeptidase [Loigolactobacillus backii]
MTDRIELSACTSIMVGKKASLDGATYISRNEDRLIAIHPKKFLVQPAVSGRQEIYTSPYNGLTVPLPERGYRYTSTPNGDQSDGPNEEDGFNEKNVGESATESVYANERVLAYDPFVENGLAEDSMTTLVLPFIDSARAGVRYLGELVKKYGSAEGNGVQFSDSDEVWYMEIVTGHQWVAVRIPDDCYAVAANQIAIEAIDFSDSNNYMWADGIQQFVEQNQLNPDTDQWNFRHIFGTDTEKDHHYNTPRVWFAQRYLNPEIEQEPESPNLPFIRRANRKITVEDVQYILKSHYNETKYDPLGHGSEHDKKTYRAISLSRTANSHILQMRDNSKNGAAGVQWLGFGVPSFCPHVPFFSNATDTDESYRKLPQEMSLDSAYWLYEALAMIVESHYAEFIQADLDYQKELSQWARTKIASVDAKAENLAGDELTVYLTQQNHEIAAHYNQATKKLLADLTTQGAELSRLVFKMDPNL